MADKPADSPSSRAPADDSEDMHPGQEQQPATDDWREAEKDSDHASDAAPVAGAAASAGQPARTQADDASPPAQDEDAAPLVESARVGSKHAASRAVARKQSASGDKGRADDVSAESQLAEKTPTSQTKADAATDAGEEDLQPQTGQVAQGKTADEIGEGQPAAVPADPLPAASPETAASAAANGLTPNAPGETAKATDPAALPASDSSSDDPAEVRKTQRAARRSLPPAGALVLDNSQASQLELQAATPDEDGTLHASVQPGDEATAQGDLSAADNKREVVTGHAPAGPSSDAKMADPAGSRNAPAHASDAAGQQSDEGSRTDAADRARFVQRVARAFESAADRGGHVRLRLYPPELGSLRLDLTVRNGLLNARLETETESARNMLLESLPALKERLTGHQIQVERFDIEWRGQGQGGLPQRSGDADRWQPPPPGRGSRLSGGVAAASGPDVAGAARRLNPGTSFDVVI